MKMFNKKLFKESKAINSMMGRLKENSVFNKIFFMIVAVLFLGTVSVFAGNILVSEDGIQSDNYYSSDGDVGLTQNITYAGGDGENYTLIIKNGLIINTTSSEGGQSNSSFPTENLVSYYKLDNNDFTDSLGVNNGTNTDSTNTSGIILDGRDFDGNDYVSFGDITSLDNEEEITISLWFNLDAFNVRGTFIAKAQGVAGQESFFVFQHTTNDLYFQIMTSDEVYQSGTSSVAGLTLGVWYHWVGVLNATHTNSYINGTLVDSTPRATTGYGVLPTASPLSLGRTSPGYPYYFNGQIDEVGIWNVALNQTAIIDLYNSGDGLTYP